MQQPSPQKVQIKQFVWRVIKAFHKELITYHMDSYKNVYPNNVSLFFNMKRLSSRCNE